MIPVVIRSSPGVKRDGTQFEGDFYVDSQWCRFYRRLPRKIGGYRSVTTQLPGVARGMHVFSRTGVQYAHVGSSTNLTQIQMDSQGLLLFLVDRTPAGAANAANLWQFDVMWDAVSSTNRLIAHPGRNIEAIDSSTTSSIYVGDVSGASAPAAVASSACSGGICVLAPYLMYFGDDGFIGWSVANRPTDLTGTGSGSARITGSKIVRGMPMRGSGGGPAGIFWSLDSVLRANFVGGATVWAFDTISSESSILSSQGVIEYDGIYYWAGVDRFLMFNGVVREVPNEMNSDWFFDNLNYAQRQKVFAFKVPRYGEIWWCYPRGGATECTHAVIYNVRENTWYDTALPGAGRSAGVFAKVYNRPFMCGVDRFTGDTFALWQHETGVDEVNGTSVQPIRSYFETSEITMLVGDKPVDKALSVSRIEPDFVQSGPMLMSVAGRANARAPEDYSETFTFDEVPSSSSQQTIATKEVRRLMRFRFESNVQGGDYYCGQNIAHVQPADGRVNK